MSLEYPIIYEEQIKLLLIYNHRTHLNVILMHSRHLDDLKSWWIKGRDWNKLVKAVLDEFRISHNIWGANKVDVNILSSDSFGCNSDTLKKFNYIWRLDESREGTVINYWRRSLMSLEYPITYEEQIKLVLIYYHRIHLNKILCTKQIGYIESLDESREWTLIS